MTELENLEAEFEGAYEDNSEQPYPRCSSTAGPRIQHDCLMVSTARNGALVSLIFRPKEGGCIDVSASESGGREAQYSITIEELATALIEVWEKSPESKQAR